ncbi:hypothetical protein [Streptantibioticus ferralitis]|uniref:Uncharacterized protein n=1 Tax=Streptantibioticus ferralitis TaxID=236510 RepID=A0ABT5YXZ7_9ACTN|nr:hypothetical protein [Streptantibioticus ferralitis]MDF2256368.1 hypothetical protein [Streptantibioticus ferralitis]
MAKSLGAADITIARNTAGIVRPFNDNDPWNSGDDDYRNDDDNAWNGADGKDHP